MASDPGERMKIVIGYAVWATLCAAAAGVALSLIHTWFFSYHATRPGFWRTLLEDAAVTIGIAAGQGAVALVTGSVLTQFGRGLHATVLLGLLVEVLEQVVRRLLASGAAAERIAAAPAPPPLPAPPRRAQPTPDPAPESPLSSSPPPPAADFEQWFGQRGLLVVGVLALLTAAGFFLKYAFDRGWIAPVVRSLLAIVAGIALGAWGEARIRGGLRRYGAAMIGAGGGLAYLGLWAAAGPYGLLERRIGVLLLAACTIVVTLLALRHEIEGLAIWALAGAYLAPILLPPPTPNPEAF